MKNLIPWLIIPTILASCSSAQETRGLDEKLVEARDVKTGQELGKQAEELTSTAPGLTADQRTKLDAIRVRTRNKLNAIRDESLKVRSLLIQDVFANPPNNKEIDAAKNRLKTLSKERIETLFSAADDANEALGRNEMMRQAMDVQFIEDDFNFW